MADSHHLLPRLGAQLKRKSISPPAKVEKRLRLALMLNNGRNHTLTTHFQQLHVELSVKNIPVLPLKGLYLAHTCYPTLEERVMGDLDLLVPKPEMSATIAAAKRCGFEPSKPIVLEAWLNNHHQVAGMVHQQTGMIVEWHWHIAPQRTQIPISIDEVWQRTTSTMLAGCPVAHLSAEDMVLHLVHHLVYHHDFLFGLRSLCDLDLVWRQTAVSPQKLMALGHRYGISKGLHLALALTKQHFKTPVPASLLDAICPLDFDPSYLTLATQQLCTLPAEYEAASLTRRRVGEAVSVGAKIRALQTAVFPTAAQMAVRYGLDPHTPHLYRYLYRWRSLVVQAWHGRHQITAVSPILKRKRQLTKWLYAKP